MPFSLRTLRTIRSLAALGGWVVLSLFFMGQAAGYIPSTITSTHQLLQEHIHQDEATRLSLETHRMRQEQLIERLGLALRVLCENSAKNNWEMNNCRNIK